MTARSRKAPFPCPPSPAFWPGAICSSCDILHVMNLRLTLLAATALLTCGLFAQAPNPDVTGRWSGVADTVDEGGTKRQEKQSIEIRMEDGKLTGNRIDKDGKPGLKLDVQQSGDKVNAYVYLDFEGGEPLRWK